MSSIKLTADSGGGTFEIKAPSSSGNTRVLTLPDTGNLTLGGPYGKILQVKQSVKKDTFSATIAGDAISGDITGLNVSITPSNASNKILLFPQVTGSEFCENMFLYKDGSVITDAIGDASGSLDRASFGSNSDSSIRVLTMGGMYLDTAGGTSAITYSIRLGSTRSTSQTFYINRMISESYSGFTMGRYISTFTVMEVAA